MYTLHSEIISIIGSHLQSDNDFKSCLLSCKLFSSIMYNHKYKYIICKKDSFITFDKLKTILKQQPFLHNITISIYADLTDDNINQISLVINYICSLEQIKKISILFFSNINFCTFFENNNHCDKCSIFLIFHQNYKIENVNFPIKQFDNLILHINNYWYNACKHIFPLCNVITFTKYKTDNIITISFENVNPNKTTILIYSFDMLLLIKGSKAVKFFVCADTYMYGNDLITIENFYINNPLDQLEEFVMQNIDINLSSNFNNYYLYKLFPIIKAKKYVIASLYHIYILPFLNRLNKHFNIDFNNIYLLCRSIDSCIVSRLCQLLLNQNITTFKISNGTHSALYFLARRVRGFLIFAFSPS